ncbi:cupin domain-containing protein [Streptomyces sp. PTM05]|uniref:Cupin domain-containing protein n=1 Tax=Streptantibioticus parmotrematis TaxID=2873249 RepID=A0ABS7QQ93_9ACTN|nr:cupin domain-containing protein [Streptantibioticus parmotrematis]MBY8884012.1 cupin domain-containing protein [Streptantibioticus parmotrematis]
METDPDLETRRTGDMGVLAGALRLLAAAPVPTDGIPRTFEASEDALGVLTIDHIEDFLEASLLRYPFAGLVKNGVPVPVAEYTTTKRVAASGQSLYVDPKAVLRHFHAGATLALRGLEQWHVPARELVRGLSAAVGAEVRATAFLTPPGSQGLAVHRDEYHVFAVQTYGRKRWLLHGVPDDDRWRGGRIAGDATPAVDEVVEVRAGHVMFMECGTAHEAMTESEPSLHIGIGVHPPRVTDAVKSLVGQVLRSVGPDFLSLDRTAAEQQIRVAVSRVVLELAACDAGKAAAALFDEATALARAPRPSFRLDRA